MNLHEITHWRGILGKAGALFCALFLISAIDGLVLRFRHPENLFQLLPGQTVDVNGSMKDNDRNLDALASISSSESIRLSFDALQTGYWFGGYMWRGALSVNPQAVPGEYDLKVVSKGDPTQKPSSIFLVKVYSDAAGIRRDSKSLIRRYVGVSPWWALGCFLPLTALATGGVFYLSHKRDHVLVQLGMAEVYRVSRNDGGYEIAFGLGRVHGVQPGADLLLMDEDGVHIGDFKAAEVYEKDSTALVKEGLSVKHGFMVALKA